MSNTPIKVMIVDDHAMFLEGIEMILNAEPDIELTGIATSGQGALTKVEASLPDVLISDLSMGEMDGLSLTKELVSRFPQLKILILTMHHDGQTVKDLLDAGAAGYILKDSDRKELLKAVRTVYTEGKYFSEVVKNALVSSMMKQRKNEGTAKEGNVSLTAREHEVLKLIANEHTNPEISEMLFISLHTVETHRRNLIKKLKVHNGVGLLKQGLKLGLLNVDDTPT